MVKSDCLFSKLYSWLNNEVHVKLLARNVVRDRHLGFEISIRLLFSTNGNVKQGNGLSRNLVGTPTAVFS